MTPTSKSGVMARWTDRAIRLICGMREAIASQLNSSAQMVNDCSVMYLKRRSVSAATCTCGRDQGLGVEGLETEDLGIERWKGQKGGSARINVSFGVARRVKGTARTHTPHLGLCKAIEARVV